jgi:hypothetical protein
MGLSFTKPESWQQQYKEEYDEFQEDASIHINPLDH